MKRLFQRTPSGSSIPRSSSRGSSPSSPDSAGDGSPQRRGRERRSYSPEKLAAVFRRSSPEKRASSQPREDGDNEKKPPRDVKRSASVSISDDELHGKVVEYMTAASDASQDAALRDIHTAILEDVAASGVRMRVSQKDTDKLISVCSQRLRLACQRKLDAFNAAILQSSSQVPANFLGESGDLDRFLVALDVLKDLLSENQSKTANHVILVVSERLPSTLVKVLKACAQSADQSGSDGRLADLVIAVLTRLVRFRETIHEFVEASTLHRLFLLRFDSATRQLAALQLVESLVESMEGPLWTAALPQLHEHRCLLELLACARDINSLISIVSICARVLRAAYHRSNLLLHKQLRLEQFYALAFSVFEESFDLNSEDARECQDKLRVAIGDLCLSGSESAVVVGDVTSDQCFALSPEKTPSTRSNFNVEAFSLVTQILEFLHIESDRNDHSGGLPAVDTVSASRQRLECQYIQKIGRLIAENRFDYVLIRRSGVMEQLLRRLNKLSEVTKHAVGSVLAATAIEANVVPYSELTTIGVYISHASQPSANASRSSDLLVLLGFVGNLLRFHPAYRSILRATGVMESVIALFQHQTVLFSSDEVASTKINIAYPTSMLKLGHNSWHQRYSAGATANDWVLPVNEKNLIMFLTSHCRQNCTARRLNARQAECVDRRVFVLLLEVLIAFADLPSAIIRDSARDGEEDEAFQLGMCETPFLECLCILLSDDSYQDAALQLWMAVLRIALRVKKQNTSTYNTVNCMLQSLRYVALSLYYKNEEGITFAFRGSVDVLVSGLRFIETILRPKSSLEMSISAKASSPISSGKSNDRDRLLVAFTDSGGLYTFLAVCCALIRSVGGEEPLSAEEPSLENLGPSDRAFLLATRLVQILVGSNATVSELFNCAVSFNFYGGLVHEYSNQRLSRLESDDGNKLISTSPDFCRKCLQGLLGFAVGDYEATCDDQTFRGWGDIRLVVQPGAMIVFVQLLRLWSWLLDETDIDGMLSIMATLLTSQENARICGHAKICEVLLECFASLGSHGHEEEDLGVLKGNNFIGEALLDTNNRFHARLLAMFEQVAAGGVAHSLCARWIKLIVDASSGLRALHYKGGQPSDQFTISPILDALTRLALGSSSSFDIPAVSFDASRDGFAQMQIPEVLIRSQGFSAYHSSGSSTSSSSASTSSSFPALSTKIWPPPDGYTAMVWFRIDGTETKDAREKNYWDSLMTNTCVLCRSAMKEESALKCSHRACRACHDALINCGGECVVCNPPMFYLFRFRSGDAKSVSELFLRGPKLYMRTSAATKTGVHQFIHTPLHAGRWYHAAVVHSKQRFQSSQASLFLNGVLQETVKMSYPSSISTGQPLSGLVGIPAQAQRVSVSKWTIGAFYLLDEPLSAHLVNGVYAVGPSYGGLYVGPSGNNEIFVSVDHLTVENLLLLDEYTRDPIRTLIESVEAAERSGKNSILRSSLSLASAASSAAAAIVQDIKARSSSASIFARIPSAVPVVSIPVGQDRIVLVYSSSTSFGYDMSVMPCGKFDGRPLAQLLGGAEASPHFSLADTLHDLCGSGSRFVYMLLERATTSCELELSLELLWRLLRGHWKNLIAMEYEHGYGIVNYLLHQKPGRLLSTRILSLLFRIAGIDIENDTETRLGHSRSQARESAVRNLLALQHFILDYSLWQKTNSSTQKTLFSSLYACLMVGGDDAEALVRERNRAQLQSLSLVRQLLYVFLDPDVENDLLRVIADLILVCLTGSSTGSRNEAGSIEANFADIASFLASSLSPRFARSREVSDDLHKIELNVPPTSSAKNSFDVIADLSSDMQSPVGRLCLSPRGKGMRANGSHDWLSHSEAVVSTSLSHPTSPEGSPSQLSLFNSLPSHMRQTQTQDLLLDILTKAVQKYDLKENREHNEVDGMYVENGSVSSSGTSLPTPTTGGPSNSQRIQIPSSGSKLAGFRRVLSPRWIGYFLFPAIDASCSVTIAPSTVVAALKLLSALLARARYESVFRKEGYYRLLAQGLPCDHRAFLAGGSSFPFDHMWYALFSMVLGPPVDGMPHNIQFDMFYLTKDFGMNIERDRLVNSHITWVILALMRRHYNDVVAFAALRKLRISPEKSILDQVAHVLYARSPDGTLYHTQVLDFFYHVYASMPALRNTLVLSPGSSTSSSGHTGSGSSSTSESKLRGEILEELALLSCGVARAELYLKYAPTEKRIHQTLLNQKRDLNAVEFATCAIQIVEQRAAEDDDGEDPFQHPVAVRALKVLVAILCDFLVLHPKGVDHVEAFFDSQAGIALAPPLHDGLQLRFQTLTMMSLLEQVRAKFADESVLANYKDFAPNIKEFMVLAIQKMHMWQRAQHGDVCPTAFACCGDKFHFAGGPLVLLDLALFFLGDTTAGSTASTSSASTSSTLGQLIQDKLNSSKGGKPQKRRHTLRSMILGKVHFGSSKSAEIEGLASSMYSAVNSVILHVLQGHGSEVSDDECETLLQLVHIHRDVVLNARNAQDREFFVCLCRFLLQLLAAGGSEGRSSGGEVDTALQEVAAQVWIDLMQLQRPLMIDLLTVELRRAGGAPYVVNLMKNGFDVLLECPRPDIEASSTALVDSAPFKKFKGWLEIVGPPLKELETNLDRVFVRRMVESKEVVREAWAASHKRVAQRRAKDNKRFITHFDWFVSMEREYFESLVEAQQVEFRRQLKWRQDRVDRQKFHARQWQKLRHDLMEQALRNCESDGTTTELSNSVAREIARRSRPSASKQRTSWQLDATEGPARMRKRLIAKAQPELPVPTRQSIVMTASMADWKSPLSLKHSRRGSNRVKHRRRFSESDLDYLRIYSDADLATRVVDAPDHLQLSKKPRQVEDKPRPLSRRISFESLLRGSLLESSVREDQYDGRLRNDSELSATRDHDSSDEDEHGLDSSLVGRPSFGDEDDADAVDEKLRPLLVPGDEILDIYDCLRVDGMDACPGVFILCSDHLYIVDNYQLIVQYGPTLPGSRDRRSMGISDNAVSAKVMEVSTEAPTRLERRLSLRFQLPSPAIDGPSTPLTPSGMLTMQRSTFTHQCRFWAYEDVVELHKRRHQLRHVALELFAHDGRNYLITFESPQQRESVFHSLIAKCPNVRGAANGMDRTTASGDLYSQLRKLLRQNMTERWIAREITNFEYLMHLNTLAGRSYNDLTQYPVFPWVLADYTSSTLDLTDPAVYRDLTKPMGALYREDEFRARYESLAEGGDETESPMGIKPFHYGTHYSSAGIVLHYLMRMEPFTTHFIRLQGGKFDHADRLFSSVASAWKSAAGIDSAHNGTQDVKELTPEFFYLPSFLKNVNHHEFGKDQSGLVVDNVELPPWANGSAREFVRLNREALESTFVSANLHHWIDLIFGYKQQGPAAVEACNVFYHLTYEGAVDLDSITDLAMRRAMVDQISEFGQTPSQLFKTPHPPRVRLTSSTPTLGTLGPSSSSVSDSGSAPSSVNGVLTVGSPPPSSMLSARAALASSFIEGSDIVSRMQSILNNSALGSGGSLSEDATAILEHASMLQQEPRRDVALNPLVAAHRGQQQQMYNAPSTAMRARQLSSGVPAASIHQIAISSASVTRDERVAAVGDRCLLIPPRHHEFFAWGFQDRSLKILSTGPTEVAYGSDSKIVASYEIEFAISVACMTSDGRTLVAGGAVAPVVRLWQFGASKRSAIVSSSSSGVGRKRAYSVGLHSSGPSSRSLTPMATLYSPSHQSPITAVHVCRAYSVVVSGCSGGVAVLWDLNRLRYSRTLVPLQPSSAHREPISAVAINEVSGDIAVASGALFGVYDVNGELLARLRHESLLHDAQAPRAAVTSLAVNRSEASEWSKEKAVVTGHADGVLCVWAYSHTGYGDSDVALELKGRHVVSKALGGGSAPRSAVTAVMLTADERKLLTGTADGLLTLWAPAQGPATPTKVASASPSLP